MTPTQARAFLAVATGGSFSGAAKRLNVSQPSVTTQVGSIERHYKVELFHRTGRGVQLSRAGTALLPMVRRLFTSLDEATAYLEDVRGQRHGYIRVGSGIEGSRSLNPGPLDLPEYGKFGLASPMNPRVYSRASLHLVQDLERCIHHLHIHSSPVRAHAEE